MKFSMPSDTSFKLHPQFELAPNGFLTVSAFLAETQICLHRIDVFFEERIAFRVGWEVHLGQSQTQRTVK